MKRCLYLVCYDIAHPKRLQRVHRFLLGFRLSWQKSVYECWLTQGELAFVRTTLQRLIVESEDRIHILQLDPRMHIICMGTAERQNLGLFLIT